MVHKTATVLDAISIRSNAMWSGVVSLARVRCKCHFAYCKSYDVRRMAKPTKLGCIKRNCSCRVQRTVCTRTPDAISYHFIFLVPLVLIERAHALSLSPHFRLCELRQRQLWFHYVAHFHSSRPIGLDARRAPRHTTSSTFDAFDVALCVASAPSLPLNRCKPSKSIRIICVVIRCVCEYNVIVYYVLFIDFFRFAFNSS